MKPIYRAGHLLCSSAHRLLFPGECSGVEHIPKQGGFLLASNHLSFLDPPIIGGHVPREIHFFARKTLFTDGWWGQLLRAVNAVPVDIDSDHDLTAIKQVLRLLKAGNGLLLFPEGTRSPDGKLQKARSGIGLIACKAQVPVVPARLFGAHDAFGKGKPLRPFTGVDVAFGPPLQPDDFVATGKGKQRYQAVSEQIMAAISNLTPPEPGI